MQTNYNEVAVLQQDGDQNQNELYWPGMFTHTRNLL